MQNKLKSGFSILAITLFFIFAIASEGPDRNTNTTVDTYGCEDKPNASGTVQVVINHKDKSGAAIPFSTGRIYITQQNVYDTPSCKFFTDYDQHDFMTDVNGRYVYSKAFNHDNSKDLNRFQVAINKSATHTGYDLTKVAFYSTTNVTFNAVSIRLDNL